MELLGKNIVNVDYGDRKDRTAQKLYFNNKLIGDVDDVIQKLEQISKLEEELGIPLEVLFKALKNGIWVINKEYVYDGYHIEVVLIGDKYNQFLLQDFDYNIWELKDYGKTWGLTKEELDDRK